MTAVVKGRVMLMAMNVWIAENPARLRVTNIARRKSLGIYPCPANNHALKDHSRLTGRGCPESTPDPSTPYTARNELLNHSARSDSGDYPPVYPPKMTTSTMSVMSDVTIVATLHLTRFLPRIWSTGTNDTRPPYCCTSLPCKNLGPLLPTTLLRITLSPHQGARWVSELSQKTSWSSMMRMLECSYEAQVNKAGQRQCRCNRCCGHSRKNEAYEGK